MILDWPPFDPTSVRGHRQAGNIKRRGMFTLSVWGDDFKLPGVDNQLFLR